MPSKHKTRRLLPKPTKDKYISQFNFNIWQLSMAIVLIIVIGFVIWKAFAASNPTASICPTNPSSSCMPVQDMPNWRHIFADDFTTNVALGDFPTSVSTKWWAYPYGWKDTSKNGTYWPEKTLSQSDGLLKIDLHTENGVHAVAAPVPLPKGKNASGYPQGMLYGRYAVRFKADPVSGYKVAWLLWPDSEIWPRDGEIDFPEGDLNQTVSAFTHRMNGVSGSDQDAFKTTTPFTGWHTAIIEWSPKSITYILDDKVIGTSTSRIPSTPMHWVLQTETSLSGKPRSDARGNVLIDWVSIWSYDPNLSPTMQPTLLTPIPSLSTTPLTPSPTLSLSPSPMISPSIPGTKTNSNGAAKY